MGIYIDSQCDLPLWRKEDPETSKAAGRAARETGLVGRHEQLILEALAAGPGTKDELASRIGTLSEQQVARRMAGMKRRGLVVDTGKRRASASGCAERVWRVAS